jgi:hypothetical protein
MRSLLKFPAAVWWALANSGPIRLAALAQGGLFDFVQDDSLFYFSGRGSTLFRGFQGAGGADEQKVSACRAFREKMFHVEHFFVELIFLKLFFQRFLPCTDRRKTPHLPMAADVGHPESKRCSTWNIFSGWRPDHPVGCYSSHPALIWPHWQIGSETIL